MREPIPTTNTDVDLNNIDHVPSNGTHLVSNAMLYVIDVNEAVIKMIIKGRSPTMRQMSRTPVELLRIGYLTELILILKFKFDTIDTKHQFAEMLTKGNFTRGEGQR